MENPLKNILFQDSYQESSYHSFRNTVTVLLDKSVQDIDFLFIFMARDVGGVHEILCNLNILLLKLKSALFPLTIQEI